MIVGMLYGLIISVPTENGKKVLTMAEYIEREALRKVMQMATDDPTCPMHIAATVDQYITEAPAADVAPVRHGRWVFGKDLPYSWGQIPKNKYHLYCSECLEQAFNRSEDNDPDFDVDSSYCPNCGAKMIEVSGVE